MLRPGIVGMRGTISDGHTTTAMHEYRVHSSINQQCRMLSFINLIANSSLGSPQEIILPADITSVPKRIQTRESATARKVHSYTSVRDKYRSPTPFHQPEWPRAVEAPIVTGFC